MTEHRDPAVEAAKRAWMTHGYNIARSEAARVVTEAAAREALAPIRRVWDTSEAAAREALAPIRKLHKPSVDECHCCRHCVECDAIGTGWPCDTARLIYTSEELSDE